MWNREALHFTSDYAPRLLFEVGIAIGFLVILSVLLFLRK